jgi:hypothetical protein
MKFSALGTLSKLPLLHSQADGVGSDFAFVFQRDTTELHLLP